MTCPVCAYARLPYPPSDYNICPCCGTEFGNDDAIVSHDELRRTWIRGGANWFFDEAPMHWNPWTQLIRAGLGEYVQKEFPTVSFHAGTVVGQTVARNPLQKFVVVQDLPRYQFAA